MKFSTWRRVSKIASALILLALAAAVPAITASAEHASGDNFASISFTDIVTGSDANDDSDDPYADLKDEENQDSEEDGTTVSDGDASEVVTSSDAPEDEEVDETEDGWVTSGGKSVYYDDGEIVSGAVYDKGITYYTGKGYFEPVTGWKRVDGSSYYFEKGIAATGRHIVDGKLYFFDRYGELCEYNGWVTLTDERTGTKESFYFIDDAAATGLFEVEGKLYLFDEQGRLSAHNGWKSFWDAALCIERKCYLSNGSAMTGLQTIDSELYCFDSAGRLVADGWRDTDDGRCYVRDGVVQTGFVSIGGSIYYINDNGFFVEHSGWITIDGGRYMLSRGVVRTGIVDADGEKYYFDENFNGRMMRGLIKHEDQLYYADFDGKLAGGPRSIDGKYYYFGDNGCAITGWKIVGSKNYYFGSDFCAVTGWFQNGGYYYYGGSDGAILTDCTVDGYKLDSNGRRQAATGLEGRVLSVIASCTNDSMSDLKKLEACYKWVINNCSYKRDYADPTKLASGWTSKYALEMLSGRKGNCYRYAAAVAYLAEGLGYDAKVVTGKIVAYGGGMTAHGWAEVVIDGSTYIFDANMDDSKNKFICFKKTYSNFPYKISKGKTYNVNL